MYAKVFNLAGDCASPYLDCPLQKLQTDPTPDCAACGVDLKQSIALRYNTVNNFFPEGYADEDKWQAELEQIIADSGDQNSALKSYVPDEETNVWVTEGSFWSWQSPYAMGRACSGVLPSVGGIMSWAIGQGETDARHLEPDLRLTVIYSFVQIRRGSTTSRPCRRALRPDLTRDTESRQRGTSSSPDTKKAGTEAFRDTST